MLPNKLGDASLVVIRTNSLRSTIADRGLTNDHAGISCQWSSVSRPALECGTTSSDLLQKDLKLEGQVLHFNLASDHTSSLTRSAKAELQKLAPPECSVMQRFNIVAQWAP